MQRGAFATINLHVYFLLHHRVCVAGALWSRVVSGGGVGNVHAGAEMFADSTFTFSIREPD